MKMFKKLVSPFLSLALATALVSASPLEQPLAKARRTDEPHPKNFGVVLFRAMLLEDMISIVDPLQAVSKQFPLNLYLLSATLDPVTTEPASAAMNPHNSSFWPTINPTHTFAAAPDDIEVLIVPGGPGVRAPDVSPMTDFIRERYPRLRYLLTVCTGSGLAARSGVLDGRRATTNKKSWDGITAYGPNTTWVSPARWVVDGNIWTASGVTAGLDLAYAWIEHIWGSELSYFISGLQEYVPHPQDFDPFSVRFNVTPSGSL